MTETAAKTKPGTPSGMGVHSEVGRLRTVMLHRPGNELRRLTPRNSDRLLFDSLPWVDRAQDEHDAFADTLRGRGVEVLYLATLLIETLEQPEARARAVDLTLTDLRLGDQLRAQLRQQVDDLTADELVGILMAGLRNDEYRGQRTLVTSLLAEDDFIIDPLPNLLFTRDSSVWIGERPAVTSLAMPARKRETQLTDLIYRFHPRFNAPDHSVRTEPIYGWDLEHVEGGDVLALAKGVLAIGVGERTTPAGAERLARTVFNEGLAHTLVAVPIDQERATMHLDTIATMVDVDKMVMYPNVAHRLTAMIVRGENDELVVSTPKPFFEAAAEAMGIEKLHLIDTGLDPVTAEREQWDDGNNTLALSPKVAVAYERNKETNERLEKAGIEVLAIAGSELGSGRGGPRCMSCPIWRDPLPS